jgi:2-keto-3-deoxy-L-fuconate dehydrogenase
VDGTDVAAVNTMAASVGPVDSAIHCVGYVDQGAILECDEARWARSFSINVDSFFFLARAILPAMCERRSGSIVCISSVASSVKGFVNRAAYGSTKAALIGLVKSIAADYVTDGVRCNAVCPGTVDSPSLRQRIEELGRTVGGTDKALAMFVSRQPMGRMCTPAEVAKLCLYLASDESRFVTGQAYAIDGGITI